jgi:hypothetical protein
MAGLIEKKMEQEPMEGAGPDESMQHEAMEGETPEMDMTPEGVRKGMKLPEGMEAAYDKIIKAGLRVMFDPSTREETASFIEESGGDPAKLAEGVTAVVVALFEQSNQTMPPNLIIPAGIELSVHAAEVAANSGMELPKEAVAEMMAEVVQQILVKFGATPEQMQKMMSGMDSGQSMGQAPQGA